MQPGFDRDLLQACPPSNPLNLSVTHLGLVDRPEDGDMSREGGRERGRAERVVALFAAP